MRLLQYFTRVLRTALDRALPWVAFQRFRGFIASITETGTLAKTFQHVRQASSGPNAHLRPICARAPVRHVNNYCLDWLSVTGDGRRGDRSSRRILSTLLMASATRVRHRNHHQCARASQVSQILSPFNIILFFFLFKQNSNKMLKNYTLSGGIKRDVHTPELLRH